MSDGSANYHHAFQAKNIITTSPQTYWFSQSINSSGRGIGIVVACFEVLMDSQSNPIQIDPA